MAEKLCSQLTALQSTQSSHILLRWGQNERWSIKCVLTRLPQLVALSLVAGIGLCLPLASPDHGYGPKCRTVYETSYKTTYETIYQVWYGMVGYRVIRGHLPQPACTTVYEQACSTSYKTEYQTSYKVFLRYV